MKQLLLLCLLMSVSACVAELKDRRYGDQDYRYDNNDRDHRLDDRNNHRNNDERKRSHYRDHDYRRN